MKIPTWGYIIGIFMLLIGGCSGTSSIQAIYTPTILDMQKKMMQGFTEGSKSVKTDSLSNQNQQNTKSSKELNSDQKKLIKNMSETMEQMFYMSDYAKKWSVIFGYTGVLISFIYMLAGVFLMIRKPFSINLVYIALGLFILFNLFSVLYFSINKRLVK